MTGTMTRTTNHMGPTTWSEQSWTNGAQVLDIKDVDFNTIADGEYIGICQNKILLAVVKVHVKDHEISDIEILEHKDSYMEQAKQIADDVCSNQSLEVDAISGATLTSKTVLKAIENALTENQ